MPGVASEDEVEDVATGDGAPVPPDVETASGQGAVVDPDYDVGAGLLATPIDLSEVTYVPAVEHSPRITDPPQHSDESEEDENATGIDEEDEDTSDRDDYSADPDGYLDAAPDLSKAVAAAEGSLSPDVSEALGA